MGCGKLKAWPLGWCKVANVRLALRSIDWVQVVVENGEDLAVQDAEATQAGCEARETLK